MGLKYTESHEWTRIEDDNIVVIGISDFAVSEVGDIVFVEFEGVDSIAKGDTFGVLETVKAVFDLYSPVSGEVVETNSGIEDDPADVQNDPMGKGWIIKIKASDLSELDVLMDEEAYREFIQKKE